MRTSAVTLGIIVACFGSSAFVRQAVAVAISDPPVAADWAAVPLPNGSIPWATYDGTNWVKHEQPVKKVQRWGNIACAKNAATPPAVVPHWHTEFNYGGFGPTTSTVTQGNDYWIHIYYWGWGCGSSGNCDAFRNCVAQAYNAPRGLAVCNWWVDPLTAEMGLLHVGYTLVCPVPPGTNCNTWPPSVKDIMEYGPAVPPNTMMDAHVWYVLAVPPPPGRLLEWKNNSSQLFHWIRPDSTVPCSPKKLNVTHEPVAIYR